MRLRTCCAFALMFIALGEIKAEPLKQINIIAIEGGFSRKVIDQASKNIGIEANVTFTKDRFQMHDKLIKSLSGYDVVYGASIYMEGLKMSGKIDKGVNSKESDVQKVWKAGIFGVLKKKDFPKLSWNELFENCNSIHGKIELNSELNANSILASGTNDPSLEDLNDAYENIFKRCNFIVGNGKKSSKLRNITTGNTSYAIVTNEKAKELTALSNEIDFYVPEGPMFGWAKGWVVLNNQTKNRAASKAFINEISKIEIKEIESSIKYSSFPGGLNNDPILSLANEYSEDIQIVIRDIEYVKVFLKIESEIIRKASAL